MKRRSKAGEVVSADIDELFTDFQLYVRLYSANPRFGGGPLKLHWETVRRRRKAKSVADALADDQFITGLWNTLKEWRMDSRKAKLRLVEDFTERFRKHADCLTRLSHQQTDDD